MTILNKRVLVMFALAGLVLLVMSAFSARAQEAGPLPPAADPAGVAAQSQSTSQKASAPQQQSATGQSSATTEQAKVAKIEIPAGTHIPLILHNAISTRTARRGDPVYFETSFPVMVNGHVVIPAGSYVSGEVTEAKRPGRIHGRGELMIQLTTMIFPNSYMIRLNAIPGGSAGTGGNETVDNEGKIEGDSNKSGDVGTVVDTTVAGTGVGTAVGAASGNIGRGAGIGTASRHDSRRCFRPPDLPRR
jgi:hypothetical protein